MKLNSKNTGRIIIFKYLGITILILTILGIIFSSISTELNELVNQNLINPYISESKYFTVQMILDLVIIYFISGNIGKSIIEKDEDAFWTTFRGHIKMWIGFFFIAMFSEITLRIIEYGVDIKQFGLGILIWMFTGGPMFLIIGGIQGGTTSWFIGKEIENKKNALQHRL